MQQNVLQCAQRTAGQSLNGAHAGADTLPVVSAGAVLVHGRASAAGPQGRLARGGGVLCDLGLGGARPLPKLLPVDLRLGSEGLVGVIAPARAEVAAAAALSENSGEDHASYARGHAPPLRAVSRSCLYLWKALRSHEMRRTQAPLSPRGPQLCAAAGPTTAGCCCCSRAK